MYTHTCLFINQVADFRSIIINIYCTFNCLTYFILFLIIVIIPEQYLTFVVLWVGFITRIRFIKCLYYYRRLVTVTMSVYQERNRLSTADKRIRELSRLLSLSSGDDNSLKSADGEPEVLLIYLYICDYDRYSSSTYPFLDVAALMYRLYVARSAIRHILQTLVQSSIYFFQVLFIEY